jgi:hypothetical protein
MSGFGGQEKHGKPVKTRILRGDCITSSSSSSSASSSSSYNKTNKLH